MIRDMTREELLKVFNGIDPYTRIPAETIFDSLRGPVRTLVEVGVHDGRNAAEMLYHLRPHKFWLIDPWSANYPAGYAGNTQKDWDELYTKVTERFSLFDYVEIIREASDKAAFLIPDELDMVYLDADHAYDSIAADIKLWWPKVRVGGLLAGDDYSYDTVRKAVKELEKYLLSNNATYHLNISPSLTQWWFVKIDDVKLDNTLSEGEGADGE
jgi:predicted O-methyltransferase YrrM